MPVKTPVLTDADAGTEATITFLIYEETTTTYKVPVTHLRALGLPATPEELSELHILDIDDDSLFAAVEDIAPVEFAVTERQISFPTDA